MQKALEAAFRSTVSTSALDIESILAETVSALIILLGGGTKKRQRDDVHRAQNLWGDYKQRKKEEK
jgi:hypothetical protein